MGHQQRLKTYLSAAAMYRPAKRVPRPEVSFSCRLSISQHHSGHLDTEVRSSGTSCRLLSSTVPHLLALKRRSQNMLQISIHRNFGYRNRYMYTFVTCRVFPCGVLFLLCILYGILSPCCGLCFVGYLQCVNVW